MIYILFKLLIIILLKYVIFYVLSVYLHLLKQINIIQMNVLIFSRITLISFKHMMYGEELS